MKLKHWVVVTFLSWALFGSIDARAAEPNSDKPAANCHDTSSYVHPQIPWIGQFVYKISIKSIDGRPDDVDIETIRGPGKASNQIITDSLRAHIKKNYVCEGDSDKNVVYVVLRFKHEVPAMAAKQAALKAAYSAAYAEAAASAASAAALDIPGEALVPTSANAVCTAMGKPELPKVNAVGRLVLHVVAEIDDGKIGLIDAKVIVGSNDEALNNKFIESVVRTVRETYRCPGNHIFEQEFHFKIS